MKLTFSFIVCFIHSSEASTQAVCSSLFPSLWCVCSSLSHYLPLLGSSQKLSLFLWKANGHNFHAENVK